MPWGHFHHLWAHARRWHGALMGPLHMRAAHDASPTPRCSGFAPSQKALPAQRSHAPKCPETDYLPGSCHKRFDGTLASRTHHLLLPAMRHSSQLITRLSPPSAPQPAQPCSTSTKPTLPLPSPKTDPHLNVITNLPTTKPLHFPSAPRGTWPPPSNAPQ